MFPMSAFPDTIVTDGQRRVRQLLLDIVTSFSGSGLPTYAETTDGLPRPLTSLSLELGLTSYCDLGPRPARVTKPELRGELDLWRAVHYNMRTQRLSDKMPETLHKNIACHR